MKRYRVAVYITAYEDPIAVKACAAVIANQTFPVEKIFIVDNSTSQPTSSLNDANIVIDFHPENIGVAGGLVLGLQWATVHNYDFLWTFDQDSIPVSNCLEVLLQVYERVSQEDFKVGIIAPTPIDPRTNTVVEGAVFERDRFISCKYTSQFEPYECDAPITSGSLISIAAAKTIPPPSADLFIDGVDLDYGMCLKQNGFHNLIVPQAILKHKFGNPIKVNFFRKDRFVQKYSPLRHYYICRNHTYLDTRYAKGWYCLTSFVHRIKYMISTVILTLIYDQEDQALKIWACLIGTYHGLSGKLGKTWH